jgi:hypothetical protein
MCHFMATCFDICYVIFRPRLMWSPADYVILFFINHIFCRNYHIFKVVTVWHMTVSKASSSEVMEINL